MFAILYLVLMIALGDVVSRRFYQFQSWPHRLATSFLVGILISAPFTYLAALLFAKTASPLFWANLVYFVCAAAVVYKLNWFSTPAEVATRSITRSDVVVFVALLLFACWLMFATLNFRDGKFIIAFKAWSDFGANISLVQSFVLGHNYPTTHPFFPSEPIRYHFIFWFEAANLSYLGLNPVWSVNLLSILSFCSLVIAILTFAEVLFGSRVVARLATLLFLFSSSLYYLPVVRTATLAELVRRTDYLPSGYPWRGENWGVLTISVLGYQRHLIAGMATILMVLVFLIDRYRTRQANAPEDVGEANRQIDRSFWYAALFSGVLVGLLPFFNSPAFLASLAILGCIFLFLPYRFYVGSMIAVALLFGVPQVLLLRTRGQGQSLLHWGYTMDNPTVLQVVKYLGWSFGFKWLLIAVALIFLKGWHRKLFLAFSSLLAIAFLFQLSVDNFNNHKLLNIWTIFAATYAAFGLWQVAKVRYVGVVLAIVLGVATTLGGIIDLFPVHNDPVLTVPHKNDRLTTWVIENTKPTDLFLSQQYLTHPILFSGRKLFLGNTLFAFASGYAVGPREALYRRMFEVKDRITLVKLLNENKIDYVAIDNGVRRSQLIKSLNESVYQMTFEKVFDDSEQRYDGLVIYKVASVKTASLAPENAVRVSAFVGGQGGGLGQFAHPRGIAFDRNGDFYVADVGNGRVQKFSADGTFLATIGSTGAGQGEFREPNGVAIDSKGNIYVSDAGNHRLIKFRSDGIFEQEWQGPDPGFFGLRGITIVANDDVYVVDQGRSRIVRIGADGQVSQFGTRGVGNGELLEPTAVAVSGDKVFVADAQNGRLQVFDTNGNYQAQYGIPEWQKSIWQYPDMLIDQKSQRLYASSTITNEVLVFDLSGRMLSRLTPGGEDKLDGPSGLALSGNRTLYVVNYHGSRISRIELDRASK